MKDGPNATGEVEVWRVPAQHRVLVPEHEQLGILRPESIRRSSTRVPTLAVPPGQRSRVRTSRESFGHTTFRPAQPSHARTSECVEVLARLAGDPISRPAAHPVAELPHVRHSPPRVRLLVTEAAHAGTAYRYPL
jgi:hypothetical protein